MPTKITYTCDVCGRNSADEPELFIDAEFDLAADGRSNDVKCSECVIALTRRDEGLPAFTYLDAGYWQFGAVEYGGAYPSYSDDHEESCSFVSPTTISFLGEEMSAEGALRLIRDAEEVAEFDGVDRTVGAFTIKTSVVIDFGLPDPDVPLHIVQEVIEEWLKPALGMGESE